MCASVLSPARSETDWCRLSLCRHTRRTGMGIALSCSSHFPPLNQFDIAASERAHVVLGAVSAGKCLTEQLHVQAPEVKPIALNMLGRFDRADAARWPLHRLPDPFEFEIGDGHIVRQVVRHNDSAGFNDGLILLIGCSERGSTLHHFVRDPCYFLCDIRKRLADVEILVEGFLLLEIVS